MPFVELADGGFVWQCHPAAAGCASLINVRSVTGPLHPTFLMAWATISLVGDAGQGFPEVRDAVVCLGYVSYVVNLN